MTIEVFGQDVTFKAAPIPTAWVLSGRPHARNAVLAQSCDRTTLTMMWDCTAGRFEWRYDQDETIHLIEGSAVLTLDDGRVERVGSGDVVVFRAGATAVWEVESYVKKFAVFREPVPAPFALVVRAHAKLRQVLAEMRQPRDTAPRRPAALLQGWAQPGTGLAAREAA